MSDLLLEYKQTLAIMEQFFADGSDEDESRFIRKLDRIWYKLTERDRQTADGYSEALTSGAVTVEDFFRETFPTPVIELSSEEVSAVPLFKAGNVSAFVEQHIKQGLVYISNSPVLGAPIDPDNHLASWYTVDAANSRWQVGRAVKSLSIPLEYGAAA
ncbi:MAG: hypothetical protein WA777_11235 [Rhodanobacter sp.]